MNDQINAASNKMALAKLSELETLLKATSEDNYMTVVNEWLEANDIDWTLTTYTTQADVDMLLDEVLTEEEIEVIALHGINGNGWDRDERKEDLAEEYVSAGITGILGHLTLALETTEDVTSMGIDEEPGSVLFERNVYLDAE